MFKNLCYYLKTSYKIKLQLALNNNEQMLKTLLMFMLTVIIWKEIALLDFIKPNKTKNCLNLIKKTVKLDNSSSCL